MSRPVDNSAAVRREVSRIRRDNIRQARRNERRHQRAEFRRGFKMTMKWLTVLTITGMIATASALLAYRIILAPFQ